MEKFEKLIQSSHPVLIDFFAEWCGPCKTMKPILKDIEGKLGSEAHIETIDVDQEEVLAARYQIQAVPTFILFKNGEAVWRHTGIILGNELMKVIKQHT